MSQNTSFNGYYYLICGADLTPNCKQHLNRPEPPTNLEVAPLAIDQVKFPFSHLL